MLIGTDDVRIWLSLADGDKTPNAKIDANIKAAQEFCNSFTGRKLEAAIYNTNPEFSYYDGPGKYWLYLKQYPISSVSEVKVDGDRVFGSGTAISTNDFYFYPNGKLISEGGYFTRGHRNVRVQFKAGYAPIVGGTHSAAVSTYPIPYDLRQVMVEMTVQSIRDGITALHAVETEQGTNFIRLLEGRSYWRMVLNNYRDQSTGLGNYWE